MHEAQTEPPRTVRRVERIIMAVLGAIGGAVVGLALLLAIVVAKARLGWYTFSLHDLVAIRWETLPVLFGAAGGGVLGYRDPISLDRAALRGFGALVVGVVVGAILGWWMWNPVEGSWAGGIIVGALALLAGAASAARRHVPDPHPVLSGVAGVTALVGLGVLGVIGIAGTGVREPLDLPARVDVPLPAPDDVDAVVFLVGDAGAAASERSPLLRALGADIERWSAALARDSATSVIFLGDIVYPVGVRERDHPEFAQDSSHLWSQIDLVSGVHARAHSTAGLFLPGNHDWGNQTGPGGLQRLLNLEAELTSARRGNRQVALLPTAGEPGPVVRDLSHNARIVFLDTHWFLQERSVSARDAFFERLSESLESAGDREVIVVAHHPFYSAGPHGSLVSETDVGGIEYLLKRSGTLVQDLNSPVYGELLARMRGIFDASGHTPLVFAGGHDHSLQVLENTLDFDPPYSLVSGAGSKLSPVHPATNLNWGASRPGWMMLVFRKDDRVDLFVVAGSRDALECAGGEDAVATCMAEGAAAFQLVYSARLLGSPE